MNVSVGGQSLIAPLTTLLETVQAKASDVHRLGASATLMKFRGDFVPLIDLGVLFGYRAEPLPPTKGVTLMVEDDVGGRAGLLVDEILGQRQVVIKSVQANYRAVDGIVGPHTWLALIVTVELGSQGEAVRAVQVEFQFRNLSGDPQKGLRVDGIFGPRTAGAVQGFQQALAADIPTVTVDGIVGTNTIKALQRFLNSEGYDLIVDGIAGTQTKAAFRSFNAGGCPI